MAHGKKTTNGSLIEKLNRGVRQPYAKFTRVSFVPFGSHLRLSKYTLGNGLEVNILVDHSAPVLSYQTWYRVGSRHEKKGKTGLAHLFEHLMFNQTKHLASGEFDRRIELAGGEANAATWVDWTYYYENVPSLELELVVKLEAERMQHLILDEAHVRSEKEVVANERRLRVDDDIDGSLSEVLYQLALPNHPYGWPTIGWMRDIQKFTSKDCEAFYRTYYAPNNALIVLVGDVDEEQACALIQKCYGSIRPSRLPKEEAPPPVQQKKEQLLTVYKPTATEKLLIGYLAPSISEHDYVVLTVINEILTGGRSSILHQRLVSEEEIATEVHGSVSPFYYTGIYQLSVSLRSDIAAGRALKIIDEEIARLGKKIVSDLTLEKMRNRSELSLLETLETASGKAEEIGFYETVLGDASRIFDRLEQTRGVTASEIKRVTQNLLKPQQRTVLIAKPEGSQ